MATSLVILRRSSACGCCGRRIQSGLVGQRDLIQICAVCLSELEPWLALVLHLDQGLLKLSFGGCSAEGFEHVCQEYLKARERLRRER